MARGVAENCYSGISKNILEAIDNVYGSDINLISSLAVFNR